MNAYTAYTWPADLPPVQLPNRVMVALNAIAQRSPQPITWVELSHKIWPTEFDNEDAMYARVVTIVAFIRNAMGEATVFGGKHEGYRLGVLTARPVPISSPRTLRGGTTTNKIKPRNQRSDTISAMLAAQGLAQRQRPSAKTFVKSDGISS